MEKTLQAEGLAAIEQWCSSFSVRRWAWMGRHVHEQTGLSTGAVTDNNELSSNLGHGVVCDGVIEDGGGLSKSVMEVVSIWMEDWR